MVDNADLPLSTRGLFLNRHTRRPLVKVNIQLEVKVIDVIGRHC